MVSSGPSRLEPHGCVSAFRRVLARIWHSGTRPKQLLADTAQGNRPSFGEAAPPDQAEPLYERFCEELRSMGVPVQTGVFGARMQVELVNDGPVTIILET